jgi:hypothetical protein
LVFKNAQAYNPPDSPIYKAACHLLKLFSERYNQLFEPGKNNIFPIDLSVTEGEMVEEEENAIELETFKKQIQELNKSITGFNFMLLLTTFFQISKTALRRYENRERKYRRAAFASRALMCLYPMQRRKSFVSLFQS